MKLLSQRVLGSHSGFARCPEFGLDPTFCKLVFIGSNFIDSGLTLDFTPV